MQLHLTGGGPQSGCHDRLAGGRPERLIRRVLQSREIGAEAGPRQLHLPIFVFEVSVTMHTPEEVQRYLTKWQSFGQSSVPVIASAMPASATCRGIAERRSLLLSDAWEKQDLKREDVRSALDALASQVSRGCFLRLLCHCRPYAPRLP